MGRSSTSKSAGRRPANHLAAAGLGKGKRKVQREPGTGEKAIERAQRALTKAAAKRSGKPGRFAGS